MFHDAIFVSFPFLINDDVLLAVAMLLFLYPDLKKIILLFLFYFIEILFLCVAILKKTEILMAFDHRGDVATSP